VGVATFGRHDEYTRLGRLINGVSRLFYSLVLVLVAPSIGAQMKFVEERANL
jgi:hypothetical protein